MIHPESMSMVKVPGMAKVPWSNLSSSNPIVPCVLGAPATLTPTASMSLTYELVDVPAILASPVESFIFNLNTSSVEYMAVMSVVQAIFCG